MSAYKKKLLLTGTVLFVLLSLPLIGSVKSSSEMGRLTYGGPEADVAQSLVARSDGETLNEDTSGQTEAIFGNSVDDWPMFRYDATHSGTPDNVAPVTHDLLWTAQIIIDPGAFSIVGSSPAIVGGVVYIGSDDGYLYALNASSGIQLWGRRLGDLQASSPAVVNGVVYVRVWEGIDYALDASTGGVIWNCSSCGYSGSSPAVVDGIYYVLSSGYANALNATTGAVIWRFDIGSNGDGSPVVVDDTVYISDSGRVHALDKETGTLKWSRLLRIGNTHNAPAVANGIVYVGCEDYLFYALDAETGETIWTYSTGSSDNSAPVVVDGIVYVATISQGVFALDAYTGVKIWNNPTSASWGSSVAVAGGRVYVTCNNGNMVALDSATGEELWSYSLGNAGTTSSPSIANGMLYIKGVSGYLYAFGKASQPSISIFPLVGFAGTETTVSGAGFAADSTVSAAFSGEPIALSSSSVDSLGHFSATFTIPPNSAPDYYQILVTDSSGNSASANFTVVTAPTTSWPMFMHDLQHSGSPDNIAARNNNTLWSFTVDRVRGWDPVGSSPAVVGGIVYVASQNTYVYALDAYRGTCYWRYSLGGISTLSSPVVVDGVVYIGGDEGVFALDAYTGTKIWRFAGSSSVLSVPAVSNGMVYFGSFDNSVYAVNASDGQLVWKFATGDYANSSPAVVENVVYIGSDDGYIYALDAATGALIWKFNCNYGVSASPAVVNGVVYIPSYDGNVFALDSSNGDKIWNHTTTTLGGFDASPSVGNGLVYISTENGLYALNIDTGEEVWYFDGGLIQASPAIAGGVVYVGGSNSNLYALNALTGSKIWEFSTGSYIRGEAVVANGIVYVGTLDGTVYAIGGNYHVADFNYDGKVNYQDIFMILGAYINYHEDNSYDAKYDFDNDSDIDSTDLFTFAEYYKDFHHDS